MDGGRGRQVLDMGLAALAILAWGVAGHFLLAIGYVNRLHGLALPRRRFKLCELPAVASVILAPAAALWIAATTPAGFWATLPSAWRWEHAVFGYFCGAGLVATAFLAPWARDRWHGRRRGEISAQGARIDMVARLGFRPAGDAMTRWFARIPGNEIFQLDVRIKELALEDWPAALDGFAITHLSDLHFSGRIGIEYHEQVVAEANALGSDLIAVTGDLFDAVECFAWTPRTLERLRAPQGVVFVLGNHDRRLPDTSELRRRLVEFGWTDLGGRTRRMTWRATEVLLAGNELPWFEPAPNWDTVDASSSLAPSSPRIALLHTPDQFAWAVQNRVALALAGHTHGGQVRLPWVGPIVSPSRYGVRYAGGTFREGRTVMHVSRGVSGLEPFRWNSPPEITKLVLRRARTDAS